MLTRHKFYVYYEENRVMARMDERSPVVAETCDTPQAAHDKVQSIVNPKGLTPDDFPRDAKGRKLGFNHPDFQNAISDNCEAYVTAAYGPKD